MYRYHGDRAKCQPLNPDRLRLPMTNQVAATAELRPDVRALLERHARESWIVHDDRLLVNKEVDRLLMRRRLVGFAVAVLIVLLIIGGKMLFRWGLWSSSI